MIRKETLFLRRSSSCCGIVTSVGLHTFVPSKQENHWILFYCLSQFKLFSVGSILKLPKKYSDLEGRVDSSAASSVSKILRDENFCS